MARCLQLKSETHFSIFLYFISRINRDLPLIVKHLEVNETDPAENMSLVLIISVITSSLRNLHVSTRAFEMLYRFPLSVGET